MEVFTLLKAFGLAFLTAAVATPLVLAVARRMGWVVQPRFDRWHKKPTAVYGGVGIFVAMIAAFVLTRPYPPEQITLLLCASGMFLVGLIDDALEMKPQLKLVCQIVLALLAVSLGVRLDAEIIPWAWVSIPLAVFWMVGITNAVNILDNMDGLSSGVVFIASTVLAVGSFLNEFTEVGPMAAMLAGAALGFLLYNFNPAKIFMGDCGSMFLGFMLAGLSILSTNTAAGASHLAMSLVLPLGALVVPIFDTTLVSYQRTMHGRSIAQGGRDHSSHRLVFLGFSERKAVSFLLLISALAGGVSLLLASLTSPLTVFVLVALLMVALAFFGIYLGDVKVYDKPKTARIWKSPVMDKMVLHKKQMLQIMVDLLLLTAAYVGAWLLRYEGSLNSYNAELLARSLPWMLAAKMLCLWFFGLYRGQWRYISVHDVVQLIKASLAGSLLTVLLILALYRFQDYSRAIFIIDFLTAFLFVAGGRSLLRIFREKVSPKNGTPVLIVGAGDGGELLLREIRNNPNLACVPVGFVDDDPAKQGAVIHGVKVLCSRQGLRQQIVDHKVERVFISILSAGGQEFKDIFDLCGELGVECTRIQPLIKL